MRVYIGSIDEKSPFIYASVFRVWRNLRVILFIKVFSVSIKNRYPCHALMHCEEYGHIRTSHVFNAGKTLFIYGLK